MSGDNDLEKRAIEELLRETDRARLRAETMGPTGWLKCPLRSTNKRFLLNTLRSTDLQQRKGEPSAGNSSTRGRTRSESSERSRDRSRSPPRDHRRDGGHSDHKHHHRDSRRHGDTKLDGDKDRRQRHKDEKDRTRVDRHNRNEDRERD